MTKPSDFSPANILEARDENDARETHRVRWALQVVGVLILLLGWLAIGVDDFGERIFIADAVVLLAMALYAIIAATEFRRNAIKQEKKLRLRLLVHNMELENMSIRDELTQLFNRRYLMERLERELHTAKGFHRPLAFIAIEVISLNHINHTYGFAVGDRLLAAFGRFLLDYSRATDIPVRTSGNKFGIILPDTSKGGTHEMIERLTQALVATPLLEDVVQGSAIVISFGTSGYPWTSDSLDTIVREAEMEMASRSSVADTNGGNPSVGGEPPSGVPAAFRESGEASGGS